MARPPEPREARSEGTLHVRAIHFVLLFFGNWITRPLAQARGVCQPKPGNTVPHYAVASEGAF